MLNRLNLYFEVDRKYRESRNTRTQSKRPTKLRLDVCGGGGQPLWTDIAVGIETRLALGTMGGCSGVFRLGSDSAHYCAVVLSTMDAFWFRHECHRDANHPWNRILCSYPFVWASISLTQEGSFTSEMGS